MPHTVTADYYATGEGRTLMLLYTMEADPKAAFARRFGATMAAGAEVKEGWDFECLEAQALLPAQARRVLEAGGGWLSFAAEMHMNFS